MSEGKKDQKNNDSLSTSAQKSEWLKLKRKALRIPEKICILLNFKGKKYIWLNQ